MSKQMIEIVDKSGQVFHRITWQVGPQNLYLSKLPSHPRLFARCNTGLVELHVFPAIEFVWAGNGWERGSGLWNGSRPIQNVESEFVPSVAKIREMSRPGRKAG
jgi:hypothetical protein